MRERYDSEKESSPHGSCQANGKARDADGALPDRLLRSGKKGGGVVLLLSVAEAARALSLGRSKTYELIASGELEVVHIGRCSRVPVDAVEAYVERLRT